MSVVGIDWSDEAFRAWRLDGQGTVVERRESRAGLRKGTRRGLEPTLLRHVGSWLDPEVTVVLASAVADRRGGVDVPFLDAPADLARLLEGSVRRRLRDATVLVLPGLARRVPDKCDVMRREALLALGASAAADAASGGSGRGGPRLLLVPGTRSRWIRTAEGRIESFRTTIGGELLERLLDGAFGTPMSRHGRIEGTIDGPIDGTAFLAGVEQGYRSRRPLADLFAARAAAVLGERDPDTARSRLAGLLTGDEIREAEVLLKTDGEALLLIGTDERCERYARALRHLGTPVVQDSVERAALAGFDAIRASLSGAGRTRSSPDEAARPLDVARAAGRDWDEAFDELPLIALLPPLDEARTLALADTLTDAGFRLLVLSLRAPGALGTLERLAERHGGRLCLGVRDVEAPRRIDEAVAAGARAVAGLRTDPDIARRCRKRDLAWVPGVATASEAGTALRLGARALVLYPAGQIEPRGLHALVRTLPPGTPLLPAGGLTETALLPYAAAGAAGAVADEALFGDGAGARAAANAFVATWHRIERSRRALGTRADTVPEDDTPP